MLHLRNLDGVTADARKRLEAEDLATAEQWGGRLPHFIIKCSCGNVIARCSCIGTPSTETWQHPACGQMADGQ